MARYLVARLAPDELALFDETAAAVPRRGRRKHRRRDDPLGFGVADAAAVLFTTVACGVASEVAKSLAEDAGRRVADRTRGWLRRLRPGQRQGALADEAAGEDLAPLSEDTLAGVRGLAHRRAVLLGLPQDRAELLAEAVVAYLRQPTGDDA
ncbi:hypothetical protein ACFWFZ_27280 [Streptomyces sp. NPDC060232]|uniref:hypothetical protein n=1 Tax=Streptomyces sp. NPDC060232 TaxID=3347079 RepID=UPI00364CCF71